MRPSATILIENPIAVLKNTQNPTEAKAFVDFTRSARGAEHLGARTATARSCKTRLQEVDEDVPGARGSCSRSATSSRAAGRSCSRSSSIRTTASSSRSRTAAERAVAAADASAEHAARPTGQAERRAHRAARLRPARRAPTPARSSCCRSRRSSGRRRAWASRALGRDLGARRALGLRADDRLLADRRRRQRDLRDDARLGARARRVLRQALRQRAHRPAVRAADDRRRADADRALRPAAARSASTSPTPARRSSSRSRS